MTVQQVDIDGGCTPELLFERHYDEIVGFLSDDVTSNLFQLSWLENHGVRPMSDPELYAFRGIRDEKGALAAVSLVITERLALVAARNESVAATFGRWCRRRSIEFDHMVSDATAVEPFWNAYTSSSEDAKARLVRCQAMYELHAESWAEKKDRPARTEIRRATRADLEQLFFASAHMHREETLEDPLERDPETFRQHVRHRVESDRSFVWFDSHGRLKFKADISAQSRFGAQLSGVYTTPRLRGRGIATRALHDICERLFEEGMPRVVLYVNRENEAARRVYEKVGFDYHTDYRTVFVDSSA